MPKEFVLSGLRHNNLLAFLAFVGVLKLLYDTRPDWNLRAAWRDNIPTIYVDEDIHLEQLLAVILEGLKKFGSEMRRIEQINLKIEIDEFVKLQRVVSPEIMAALGSDGATTIGKKKEMVQYTPLCMMFGAGRQYFLERLKNATHIQEDEQVTEEIKDALFYEWNFSSLGINSKQKINFRWDPQEYRPHAYRDKNPSKDNMVRVVDGANRLAAVGFTVYDCVPTKNGLRTTSHRYNKKRRNGGMAGKESGTSGKEEIFWPVWRVQLSFASLLALMHYPYINRIMDVKDDKIRQDLDAYGVDRIMKAEMFWDGKFKNVHTAERSI